MRAGAPREGAVGPQTDRDPNRSQAAIVCDRHKSPTHDDVGASAEERARPIAPGGVRPSVQPLPDVRGHSGTMVPAPGCRYARNAPVPTDTCYRRSFNQPLPPPRTIPVIQNHPPTPARHTKPSRNARKADTKFYVHENKVTKFYNIEIFYYANARVTLLPTVTVRTSIGQSGASI